MTAAPGRRVHLLQLVVLVSLIACGGSSRSSGANSEPRTEHWETLTDQRLVYRGGCTIGPFEIALPAREELEYGRRVVIAVYGPRRLRLEFESVGGPVERPSYTQTGQLFADEGDHARCRVGDADTATAVATSTTPGTPGRPTGAPTGPGGPPRPTTPTRDTSTVHWPQLVAFDGVLPAMHVQGIGHGWLPLGSPWFYAEDEFRGMYMKGRLGMGPMRLRLWSDRLQDLEGVIIRVLDQKLVPDVPLDRWLAAYPRRVEDAERRRSGRAVWDEKEWKQHEARCTADPVAAGCEDFGRVIGRVPPPPREETPPRAPSDNLDWIPGYWSFDKGLDDFVWIAGTFVVRAPKVAHAPAPVVEAPTPEVVEAADAHPVDARVEAAPPPRVEVMAAAPQVVGVVWVPGYWQLVQTQWQWMPGRWISPPRGHLYRAPAIRTRGAVRVYLPGGWIRRR